MANHSAGKTVSVAGRKHVFNVWRGDQAQGELVDYEIELSEGMVVLDAVHQIQAQIAPDLACRWNCKAGKCGSCSAEVNGRPRLMCMTRMDQVIDEGPTTIRPMKAFPLIKDLATDVSFNYRTAKKIPALDPKPKDDRGEWTMYQYEIDRVQEFRKCIECYLCQNTCHVLRDHQETNFAGPRFIMRAAQLEMHPMDQADRIETVKEELGIGYCNINKCCTDVCPEGINITDNAIIPLKERVADRYYDPVKGLWAKLTGNK
ncbi:MAG: succinate dehydrogenase/fumarate reductase iron-sulfur subunit [Candidatus Sericytochromatia bacterium]|nr:succinate dehydrogenase/fumarate reductase iron-sulfur subunit [Candidatus Sericytochromatia bacterium]